MPASRSPIDYRKWFDRFQPQTLQIATWLLYFSGAFLLIDLAREGSWSWAAKEIHGATGWVVILALVACHAFAGLLMANDRKLGYWLALVAAFSPIGLRYWLLRDAFGVSTWDIISGNNTISFIFDIALIVLLLHPISREHQRVWYK